jgi:hypothetical protein
VRFAKHDHVAETFAADRADEPLNASILPGRSGCDRVVPNAHGTDPLQEDWTIRGRLTPGIDRFACTLAGSPQRVGGSGGRGWARASDGALD